MGLLADIGRSNLGQASSQLLRDANITMRTQSEMQEQDIRDRANMMKLNAMQKEQDELHRPQNIRNSVLVMSLPEDKREEFVQKYISAGYADENGVTSQFKRDKFLGENKEGVDFYFKGLKEDATRRLETAYGKYQDAFVSGDQDALAKAQTGLKAASAYAASVDGKHKDAMGLLGSSPDKIQKPVEFIGKDGKWYQGTPAGVDETGATTYTNIVPLVAKPSSSESTVNDFATFYRGEKEKNPNITDAAISDAWKKRQLDIARTSAEARGEGFAKSRAVNVLDTLDGNRPKVVSLSDALLNPDRYLPAGSGEKALNKTALIEDIRGNITNTRNFLKNLKTDFTPAQRAQLAYVLKSGDPKSSISAFMQGSVAATLTPDQVDYVTDIFQLIENGMAMRSVLGAGQGSDELRAAIRSTIPGATSPNKKFSVAQLDKFEQVINRLSAGIPKVPLRTDIGDTHTNTPTAAPAPGKGALTKDEAMEYLRKAGGDKEKAREMARRDGRSF